MCPSGEESWAGLRVEVGAGKGVWSCNLLQTWWHGAVFAAVPRASKLGLLLHCVLCCCLASLNRLHLMLPAPLASFTANPGHIPSPSCRLVGVARVPPVKDLLLDTFLMLPTDALAVMTATLEFS